MMLPTGTRAGHAAAVVLLRLIGRIHGRRHRRRVNRSRVQTIQLLLLLLLLLLEVVVLLLLLLLLLRRNVRVVLMLAKAVGRIQLEIRRRLRWRIRLDGVRVAAVRRSGGG